MEVGKERTFSLRLLAGFVGGVLLALVIRSTGQPVEIVSFIARIAGELFLRGIFMLIFPLIIPILLIGIQRLTETGAIGRIGMHTLVTVLILTAIAAGIGLVLANLLSPGLRLSSEARSALLERFGGLTPSSKLTPQELVLNLLPKNPFREMATAFTSDQQGGLLAVVSFTVLVGIALARLSSEKTQPLYHLLDIVYQASLWLLTKIMYWIAPIGIAGLVFQAVVGVGWEIFSLLGAYALTVIIGLMVHGIGIYSVFLYGFAKASPLRVFQSSIPALLMAFSSASSNATLPTTLRVAIERLRIAPPIAQFILTLGATVNQNGTALYEGVTLLFLMQVFGIPLTLTEQLLVVGLAVLIAIGAAGVPGGSLPLLAGVLPAFGIPGGAIALIYGIDRLLDMLRTTLNVYGDIVIASYLNRLYHGNTSDQRGHQNMER
ncbi:MAG: dicarboxylate/amino acid:cation symporter [Bacteroidia bacterium]|nr:dicarboxylate/amino acid:cation symporter [Bacteroidia bacterium]